MSVISETKVNTKEETKEVRAKFNIWRLLLNIFALLVISFLFIPIIIVVIMSFSSAQSLQFPPPGFSLRWYETFFSDPFWLEAAWNSIIIGVTASILALIIGGLATYGLSKTKFKGKDLLIANFIAPMIIPTIITGVALYFVFAKLGILGTIPGLIIAHTIIVIPYVVLITLPSFEAFDKNLELAAQSLGASRFKVISKIVVPLILPSFLASWLFAFIISFDEIIVTIFLSGKHYTLPKKMYNELVLQINPTITAISTILIAFTALFMLIVFIIIRRAAKKGAEIKMGN